MCELIDLVNECGSVNPPGLKVKTWWVASEDIDVMPSLKTTTGPGDTVTYDGAIVLKPNKAFKRVDIVSNSGKVMDTLVGAEGAKSYESVVDAIVPKTDPAQVEFFNCQANSCPVVLVEDKKGFVRVLGTASDPAVLESATIDTGAKTGDVRGVTFQIKSQIGIPAPFYEGAIDIDPLT